MQRAFFDHFLKGADNGFEATPRVRLEVRRSREHYDVRFVGRPGRRPNVRLTPLYLDARAGTLRPGAGGGERAHGVRLDRNAR